MTDHLQRIQKAVDYIEDHLREELPTELIAKVAAFSMWHFQKVFSFTVGLSVKDYVRQRRLTAAAEDLTATDRRLVDIALDCGFESQESFGRAFKAQFGLTPGECRRRGAGALPPRARMKITRSYLDHLYGGLTMQPRIVDNPAMSIVGMSTQFISILSPEKNNHVILPNLWGAYLKRRGEIAHPKSGTHIGLCEAIPDAGIKRHPDEYFYMAGMEVTEVGPIPLGMVAKTVPAGRYAVFTHKGRLDKLGHTMNYIFGSWLPKSGEELRDAPDLEIYDGRFHPESDDSEVDLYIPIK